MLSVLIDKLDSMQEQMGNKSREMEILRKNQKEMLKIKKILKQKWRCLMSFFSRLGAAEERIFELEIYQ